jgi:hypothetical protein
MTTGPTELVIGDPHDQAGLIDHIPEGVAPVRILNFYHYDLYPEQKAYCAKCRARRHRDGFTVELDSGSLVLAGSTCGADLWGEQWATVRSDFGTRLHEAGIILDVRGVLSELKEIRQVLAATWGPAVKKFAALQAAMPLYRALREAALSLNHRLSRPGEEPVSFEGWPFFAIENVPQLFASASIRSTSRSRRPMAAAASSACVPCGSEKRGRSWTR